MAVPLRLCALFMCRYSVNVFRPPFQSGRTSPEASLSRADHPLTTGSVAEGPGAEEEELHAVEAVAAQEQDSVSPEMATAQASAHSAEDLNSLSTRTTDSGFSELLSSSQDPLGEKEISCEKAVKPEGNFIIGSIVKLFLCFVFIICHFWVLLELTFVFVCILQLPSQGTNNPQTVIIGVVPSSISHYKMLATRK